MTQSVPGIPLAQGAREEDVRLMALVAQGDPPARRMLALRLVGRVRRLTRHLIASPADADDAAQVAMVEILQSAKSYRGDASIESWMSRITARTALRHARSQRRWYEILRGARNGAIESTAPPPRLETEALPKSAEEYLDQLSPRQREVLVLKLALDYTIEEIGDLLRVPQGTVKGRLVAGRRKLRSLVKRDVNLDAGGTGGRPHGR